MAQSYPALMYAQPESDNIHMSMQCASKGRMKIRTYNPAYGGKRLYLASGVESETFPATAIPGDGELLATDEFSSEISLKTTNPILVAFRESGALTKGDPPQAMNASTPEELAVIETFFADCDGEGS